MIDFMSPISIVADPTVKDEREVSRSWYERFFTRPWTPWKATKIVRVVRFVLESDGMYHVSPETAIKIKEYRNSKKLQYNA